MQPEVGKRYRTTDGKIAVIHTHFPLFDQYQGNLIMWGQTSPMLWNNKGESLEYPEYNLVEEHKL